MTPSARSYREVAFPFDDGPPGRAAEAQYPSDVVLLAGVLGVTPEQLVAERAADDCEQIVLWGARL